MADEIKDSTAKLWFLMNIKDVNKVVNDTWENANDQTMYKYTSRSCSYNSMSELIEGEKIQPYPCKECGGIVSTNYHHNEKMLEKHLCFRCNFWDEKVDIANDPATVRIDGEHYMIAPEDKNIGFKGFGGREFIIQFHDGRKVVSHNLWSQGFIPESFKSRLRDNAVFVKDYHGFDWALHRLQ